MKLSFASYTEFALKADILTKELSLNSEQAAELLALITGYESHSTMQIGTPIEGCSISRDELIRRLMAKRPDVSKVRAVQIIDRLNLHTRQTPLF